MRGFDVDGFVNDCGLALTEHTSQMAMKEVVERAVADPAAIDAALGSPTTGGITTLHRSPEVTVLWIVWPPAVRLFPHDHRMWAGRTRWSRASTAVPATSC
jgi:predicted metal-dependent enzyme (double-stranded beta helix superfamily)